ncbi:hypothetical protein PZB74_00695 [Porifericola rhodea]|uniref:hypothetical protein n=1 Tax=Porifericola rhodea TaxID=930972 RepID=UPI002665DD48|nr:hypothetical protein [Porifericola rhodea]WKN31876.1 hypothetical protein PZB74_00695 [Porifericola rhodea]
MRRYISTLALLLLSISFGCAPHPVQLFNAESYVRPYQTDLGDTLTIVLGKEISDQFFMQDIGLRKMQVNSFRKSLSLSLYYTFEHSFAHVNVVSEAGSGLKGTVLELYRVRPFWKLQSIASDSYSIEGGVYTSTTFYLSSLFRYDGIVLRHGEKWLTLDAEVLGEKVVSDKDEWHLAFEDGIREMCEHLYKTLAEGQRALSQK